MKYGEIGGERLYLLGMGDNIINLYYLTTKSKLVVLNSYHKKPIYSISQNIT